MRFSLMQAGYWCPLCCRTPKAAPKGYTGHPLVLGWRGKGRQGTFVQVAGPGSPAKESHVLPGAPRKGFTPWPLPHYMTSQGSDEMASSLPTGNSGILADSSLPPSRVAAIWLSFTLHLTILPYFILPKRLLLWVPAWQTSEENPTVN